MTKNELEKIVLEILGTSERSAFNAFINEIGTSLRGKEALKLDGIGVFQKKKEPLSRMERKSEGSIGEKELLLFKPENSTGEESILSFDIDEMEEGDEEFSDSVFDVSINKPTIISDDDIEDDIVQEGSGNFEKIKEFVASGEIYPDFDLLKASQTSENKIEEIVDEVTETERSTDFTEAEINKEFMIDDPMEDDEYDETSSSIEPEITEEDVLAAEESSGLLQDESSELNLSDEQDESDPKEEENPFDELESYITKDESNSDVEEIINSEPEEEEAIIPEVTEEPLKHEENSKVKEKKSFRDIRKGGDAWYKNPILYIATASLIVAITVVVIFWPSDEATNKVVTENVALVDSVKHFEKKIEKQDTNKTENVDNKTNVLKQEEPKVVSEAKKVETKKPIVKHEQKKLVNSKKEFGPLFREIKNDKSITQRIYFDGSKYMVQASSWRSTSIAEREVKKLRKRGFDAFIYKVYIKSKNGTWNRVRIGYFNSRKEAEKFLVKNKI